VRNNNKTFWYCYCCYLLTSCTCWHTVILAARGSHAIAPRVLPATEQLVVGLPIVRIVRLLFFLVVRREWAGSYTSSFSCGKLLLTDSVSDLLTHSFGPDLLLSSAQPIFVSQMIKWRKKAHSVTVINVEVRRDGLMPRPC
jgi:hypothetical protein